MANLWNPYKPRTNFSPVTDTWTRSFTVEYLHFIARYIISGHVVPKCTFLAIQVAEIHLSCLVHTAQTLCHSQLWRERKAKASSAFYSRQPAVSHLYWTPLLVWCSYWDEAETVLLQVVSWQLTWHWGGGGGGRRSGTAQYPISFPPVIRSAPVPTNTTGSPLSASSRAVDTNVSASVVACSNIIKKLPAWSRMDDIAVIRRDLLFTFPRVVVLYMHTASISGWCSGWPDILLHP